MTEQPFIASTSSHGQRASRLSSHFYARTPRLFTNITLEWARYRDVNQWLTLLLQYRKTSGNAALVGARLKSRRKTAHYTSMAMVEQMVCAALNLTRYLQTGSTAQGKRMPHQNRHQIETTITERFQQWTNRIETTGMEHFEQRTQTHRIHHRPTMMNHLHLIILDGWA